MANKSQAQSGSPKRDQPKSASVDLDFEDMLVAAIASVMIKRRKKKICVATPTVKLVAAKDLITHKTHSDAASTGGPELPTRVLAPNVSVWALREFYSTATTVMFWRGRSLGNDPIGCRGR